MSLIPNCAEKESESASEQQTEREISVCGGSGWDLGLWESNSVRGGSYAASQYGTHNPSLKSKLIFLIKE